MPTLAPQFDRVCFLLADFAAVLPEGAAPIDDALTSRVCAFFCHGNLLATLYAS